MSNPAEDYSAYASAGHNSNQDFPEITKLAEAQHHAELTVDGLEAQLKVAKETLRLIAEQKLPELMDSLGIATYSTKTGISVEIKENIRASLNVENRPRGYEWLEKNGFGGLIKSKVVVDFKRDEIDKANEFVEKLREENRIAALERKVEPMTLTAFIKEQLVGGKDVPLDIFGVYRQRVAKIEV